MDLVRLINSFEQIKISLGHCGNRKTKDEFISRTRNKKKEKKEKRLTCAAGARRERE